MANFIVVSPSLSTNGDNSANLFVYRSGAVSGSTLVGGTGNDTIQLLDGGRAGSGASFSTKGGADQLQFSAVTISAKIAGGAGGDTVTFNGTNSLKELGLGAGSDAVQIRSGLLTMQGGGSIKGAGGADIISSNTGVALSGSNLLMGAGKDTITLTATTLASANVVLGGGADVIGFNGAIKDTTIKGGAGGDSIIVTGDFDSGSVKLGNGTDTLTIEGDFASTGEVLGGKGADNVTLTGAFVLATGLLVGGGAGNDTINLGEFASAGKGASVAGGGGNDSIVLDYNEHKIDTLSAGGAAFSAGNGYGTIIGGAGADSIVFSGGGVGSAGAAGILAYTATTDSTVASMDVISFDRGTGVAGHVGAASAGDAFLLDFGGEIGTSIGASLTNSKLGISTNAGGFLASAGDNSSVAERASAMDQLLATGQVGVFKDASGSAAFIFVQGGATDLVAKFDPSNAVSAGTVALSAQGGAGEFKLQLT